MSQHNAPPADQIIPLKGMRGMIAAKMLESITTTAQLTHHAECDATGLLALKVRLAESGMTISVEDLLLDAVATALRQHPELNAVVQDNELRVKREINLAVAIALDGGLLVAPAIMNAGAMNLIERTKARRDLVDRAKTSRLTVKEMTAGTFTISNIGLSRVRYFTPILNVPQVAILGIGETSARPWVVDGKLEIRSVIGLSLTFDHRAVNGAPAAAFLTDLCRIIEAMC
jgi:pyruvate/2-oxoglutarate dehydrogenase complex dihydrolipoamide acyltransferase (E2) component